MKKMLVLGGVGIALLVACDRSIESRLQQNPSDTQQSVTTNAEEKTLQAVEKNEEDVKSQKDLLSEETKGIEETKPSKEAIHKEIVNESLSVNQSISEKEPQKSPITSETNIAPVEKSSEIKSGAKVSALVQKNELPQNSQKITKQSKKDAVKKEAIVKNTKLKDKNQPNKKIADKHIDTTENKENHSVEKISKNNHTGIYENGQLVSNFTEEELRLGAQRPLTKDEIQYYKSLCRYAYMSDQDVIENRCEAKKIRFSRKVYSS